MDQVVLPNDFNMIAVVQSTGNTTYLFGSETLNAFFPKQKTQETRSSEIESADLILSLGLKLIFFNDYTQTCCKP